MIEGIVLMVAFIGGSGLVLRHVVAFDHDTIVFVVVEVDVEYHPGS